MADLGSSVKGLWMKGMEAIGNAASSIASNTRSKVDEMNLMNRRNEILKDFSNRAYALWLKGEKFPEELDSQLRELSQLDEMLVDLRAERLAGVKTEAGKGLKEAAEETPAEEPTAEADAEPEGNPGEEEAPEAEQPEEVPAGEAGEPTEEAEPVPVIQVEQAPEAPKPDAGLSGAINDLFEKAPSAEKAAEKMNEALDSLEDHLQAFTENMGKQVESLADQLGGAKHDSPAE